jgi:hypothetical protein
MSQNITKITWESADFNWGNNPYSWNDVALIEEITRGDTSSSGVRKKVDKLEAKKKKRLVQLIMRKKGIKVYDGSKIINEDIKINIKDVEMIIKDVKAQIQAENIHV